MIAENTTIYIENQDDVDDLCLELAEKEYVALDVETTLTRPQKLCLIQFSDGISNWLIDVLCLENITEVKKLLENQRIKKIIHYARFEKAIFKQYGIYINNIYDTINVSREKHGYKTEGGHSLKAVCKRELDIEIDKTHQSSNWATRPLSKEQINYAALDAEVLIKLYKVFNSDSNIS